MTDTTDFLVVLCTTPDPEVGATLARDLVGQRLAACVNVIPAIRSFYQWQGETHDDSESQLLIKTHRDRYDALVSWLRHHHPYDEPEIIGLPLASGSPSYLEWVRAQTMPDPR